MNGGIFRSQLTVDLQRAFDCLHANDSERVILGYVREYSWNRAVAGKVKASEPWPDPLPCSIDFGFIAKHTGIHRATLTRATNALLADKVLLPYQGGITINKNVDEWSAARISRAALEYSRSAQAIRHPSGGVPADYPLPEGMRPTAPEPTVSPATLEDIRAWIRGSFGLDIPTSRIAPMAREGYPLDSIRDAFGMAFGRARKRDAEGLAGYAASCLADWRAKGKIRRQPAAQQQAPRSPPQAPPPSANRDSKFARMFEEAKRTVHESQGESADQGAIPD